MAMSAMGPTFVNDSTTSTNVPSGDGSGERRTSMLSAKKLPTKTKPLSR